jgi:hypothetical protein
VNKINKIYDDVEWRPTFYFTGTLPSSPVFPPAESKENPVTYHVEEGYPCFLPHNAHDFYGDRENVYYYTKFWLLEDSSPFHEMTVDEVRELDLDHLLEYWSTDISNLVYLYHSMYGLAQVATYLGFDEIYFVGTDLGLKYLNPHMVFDDGLDPERYDGTKIEYLKEARRKGIFFQSFVNGILMKIITTNYVDLDDVLKRILRKEDSEHFASNYLESLKIHDGPRYNRELTKGHATIKRVCEHLGVDVYNATVGGELEVYPRVDIHDLV